MTADMHEHQQAPSDNDGRRKNAAFLALFGAMLVTTPVYAATPSPTPSLVPTSSPKPAIASSPITIADGCSYKTLNSGFSFGGNATVFGKGYNFFTVKFTNNATVAASKIIFQIDFAKASRIVIPDVGTFAPGSTTQTTFRDKGSEMVFSARPTPNDGSVICTVLSAAFADGTSYAAPQATATP